MRNYPQPRLSLIDQHSPIVQTDRLYEPLRKSLLKVNQNFSESRISTHSHLTTASKINDLSTSRVSRRLKSLSPEEAQRIKSSTYIPVNTRLVPTHNYQKIRNKRFEAISVDEKVYSPVKAIPVPRFSNGKNFVEEIVYEKQTASNLNSRQQYFKYDESAYQRIASPRVSMQNRYSRNIYTDSSHTRNLSTLKSTGEFNQIRSIPRFSGFHQNIQVRNSRQSVTPTVTRQLSTEKPLTPTTWGSRTSFDQQTAHYVPSVVHSRGYDFGKSQASTSVEEYKARRKEDFQYNIYSILDEPVNTKCKHRGCLNNQFFASKPETADWQQ